jgi:VWFA-related protein
MLMMNRTDSPPSRLVALSCVGATAAIFAGTAAMLLAQAPAASGTAGSSVTFRAGTEEVLIDAVVTDKKGNFQRDLTRQDFKISEDGKDQKITSFAPGSAGAKHFIALVFDTEHLGLRDEVSQFVDRVASPDLYIAVFSRSQEQIRLRQAFTTDGGRIKAALRSMEAMKGNPFPDPDKIWGDLEVVGGTPVPRLYQESPTLHRVDGVAQTLAPIRGKKALILFTEGYIVRRREPDVYPNPGGEPLVLSVPDPILSEKIAKARTVFDDCNAAGVSVYAFEHGKNPVIPYGDFYHPPQDRRQDHGAATDLIRDLAVFTGGSSPSGDYDLVSYLASVTAGQNDYYLLGYAPPADSADKPCHKIKVKVDRRGLNVTARDSYCTSGQTSGQAMARALRPAERALDTRAANGVPGNLRVGLQLSWFYIKPGVPVVDIAAEIDPHVFKMSGKLHGEFNLLGTAYREDGSLAAQAGDTIKLDFDTPAQADEFLKFPYRCSNQFQLAPGSYRFRMVVGSGSETFSKAEKLLEIEPWTGQTLSASGIALGARAIGLTGVTAELDSSLLEGPHVLRSKGRSIVPMGGADFESGRDGVFYFEVYEPDLPRTTGGQREKLPAIRARILDRATGQEKQDLGPIDVGGFTHTGNVVIPVALDLPVSKLAVGSYTLEVRVTRDGEKDPVVRSADFRVK